MTRTGRMSTLMLAFTIVSAGQMGLAFNIEPGPWKYMTQPGEGFGYKVIQHDATSLLVSAPVEEVSANRRGRVYRCQISGCPAPPQTCSCTDLRIDAQNQHVNMSLGLWMSKEETSSSMPNPKTVVCGPTIPKECESLTLYGGMCFSISQNSALPVSGPVPPTLRDCPVNTGLDIAFLLDGSGSVNSGDFQKMKDFVINLIEKFINKNTEFAVVQFSMSCNIEMNFKDFDYYRRRNSWKKQIQQISQLGSMTYTAEAINKIMRELFVGSAGNRPKAKKVLLVITDGASNGKENLQTATNNAHYSNVICYAIGVGGYNVNELNMIASEPKPKHVFTVSDFSALDGLKATLEENIAIEGTQTSGDSTHMEFAQEGFSAALVMDSQEKYLMSAVGAYEWKGIYQEYPSSGLNPVSWKIDQMEPDSYLGYTMAVAMRRGKRHVVLGAPRYKHRGHVVIHNQYHTQKLESGQIGSYFGAELCVVDLDGDANADLILASAPMHIDGDTEGKVFVYSFSYEGDYASYSRVQDTGVSLLGMEGQRGRFGLSLASLADLNGDGIRDVAVGAPLEDNGQGSVYIFNGWRGGINPAYSQRIPGSYVKSGLQFFGLTVAQSALDQSGDRLPDIAVGSKGTVLLLRSRPIVSIDTHVTFQPPKIPKSIYDCTVPERVQARVCFTMTKDTGDRLQGLKASLNYTLILDYVRQNTRVFFDPGMKDRRGNNEATVSMNENCYQHIFFVQCHPEDVVNPVEVLVAVSFQGLPISSANQLRPILSDSSPSATNHQLSFEIDCGKDAICIDNIHLSFSGPPIIKVGIAQEMSVTVMVENKGENSYNTRVSLSYPPGLSYRTFNKSQGRVECSSLDSTDGVTLGKTECIINKPILRANDKAAFVVQYGIDESSNFGDLLTMNAKASSDNDGHDPGSQLSKSLDIGIKYSIYVILKRLQGTTNYINFTAGNNQLQRPVIQELEVTNKIRGLNLTVVIQVPIRLKDKDIWTDVDSLQVQGCTRGTRETNPTITDLQQIFKGNKEPDVNCSIAVCLEFRCHSYMVRDDQRLYSISGNVSSGWIEQTGLRSAMFHLVSSATLEYDDSKYIFYSSDSSSSPQITRIETLVEVYEKPNLIKEIIGGVVGGLILLALMTAALAKSGFFKSEYQQKLLEAEGQEGEAPPQEE